MKGPSNQDFFSKLWKCPFRKGWRYSRKFLFVVVFGILVWTTVDFIAIVLMKPKQYPPFLSLLSHAFLTITLSLVLTLTTHQFYLRFISRFRLIRLFQH